VAGGTSQDFENDCAPSAASKRRHRDNASLVGGKRHKSNSNPNPMSVVHSVPLPRTSPSPPLQSPIDENGNQEDDTNAGYNSEDEYSHLGLQLSNEEWEEKDRKFEIMMKKKGNITV
jgi:hypothetical protein